MNLSPAVFKQRVQKGLVALRHPVYRTALKNKVLAATEHEPVVRSLGPVRTVLDVGANVGQFATVARRNNPSARVLSFEPIPEAGERLRAVFAGDTRFEHVPVALSDEAGTATFHLSAADDSSSLLPIGERQISEFPATAEAATIQVEVARLDDVLADRADLEEPVLLKLDTQGSELSVLKGADEVLGKVQHILLEASFVELYTGQAMADEIVRHLDGKGFQLTSVYDVKTSTRTGEPIQADFVFTRRP